MRTVAIYRLADGVFIGSTLSGPDEYLEMNTPDGCGLHEGVVDPAKQRVDVATGELVAYQPPAPAADEYQTWSWDAESWQWVSVPTTAALARAARAERTRRIDAMTRRYERNARETRLGLPLTDSLAALDAYVQALADLPNQTGFPLTITWPQEPTS